MGFTEKNSSTQRVSAWIHRSLLASRSALPYILEPQRPVACKDEQKKRKKEKKMERKKKQTLIPPSIGPCRNMVRRGEGDNKESSPKRQRNCLHVVDIK